MYYIKVFDITTQKTFKMEFDSYYRLKYSKKLMILSMSNLVD